MMTNEKHRKASADKTVRDIRRRTRSRYSAEDKIRIVLEGLRGEDSIAVLRQINVDFWMIDLIGDSTQLV